MNFPPAFEESWLLPGSSGLRPRHPKGTAKAIRGLIAQSVFAWQGQDQKDIPWEHSGLQGEVAGDHRGISTGMLLPHWVMQHPCVVPQRRASLHGYKQQRWPRALLKMKGGIVSKQQPPQRSARFPAEQPLSPLTLSQGTGFHLQLSSP